ncbi:SRPBCC family protein [Roseovarius arcticus]|uniref:SRPBCC family protein n=1 Tax=Roseovarius arcticus TaxID=2547404 RepID=UPI001110C86A|nr:SRPBCC domain-containing protein [Roseovarius arcticus]
MKPDLHYSFQADMQTNRLTILREFDAPKDLVWDCYTKADLLDQWFAPEPFTAKTKSMAFEKGGHWHFAMVDPDGNEHWVRFDYETITPKDGYHAQDAFSDLDGGINRNMPVSTWDVTFEDATPRILVQIISTYETPEALQKVIDMGMQQGMEATLAQLDKLLQTRL